MKPNLIIDFDSTIIKTEGLDELAKIRWSHNPQKVKEVEAITNMGMSGQIDFTESLEKRLEIIDASTDDIALLVTVLMNKITTSFLENAEFISQNNQQIFVVSGGFMEYVLPVCESLGINPHHVHANHFRINHDQKITGFEKRSPLCRNGGKVTIVEQLHLSSPIWSVGDGYTDYELKKENMVNEFILFQENVRRENLVPLADHVVMDFNAVIDLFNSSN